MAVHRSRSSMTPAICADSSAICETLFADISQRTRNGIVVGGCLDQPRGIPARSRTYAGPRMSRSDGRVDAVIPGFRATHIAEERPGFVGQGDGQRPPGATRGTVPQKTDRHGEPSGFGRTGAGVRVKRWCKRPPALQVTGVARQTPPEARSDSKRSRAARPSLRVDR